MGVRAEGVSVIYAPLSGESLVALDRVSFEIADAEFITIIGPSGCGKSTLLHCLGGLLQPSSGRITIDGSAVQQPEPRRAAFVFQDHTLLPWKTVVQNVTIGLRFEGASRASCREKGEEMLSLVGLSEFADAYPHELSGGMQQRVAVARAMVMQPRILLLDEPFGALDEQTRRHLGFEMSRILTESRCTVVLVTHSLDEAIYWADRIIVLTARPGSIAKEIQVPTPRPRSPDLVASAEFSDIRRELFALLESSSIPIAAQRSGTS